MSEMYSEDPFWNNLEKMEERREEEKKAKEKEENKEDSRKIFALILLTWIAVWVTLIGVLVARDVGRMEVRVSNMDKTLMEMDMRLNNLK